LLLYALHDPVTWVLEGLALKRHLCGFAVALCVWLVYVICKQRARRQHLHAPLLLFLYQLHVIKYMVG